MSARIKLSWPAALAVTTFVVGGLAFAASVMAVFAALERTDEAIAAFDTPTHRCGNIISAPSGETINGTPVYETRCMAYYPKAGAE